MPLNCEEKNSVWARFLDPQVVPTQHCISIEGNFDVTVTKKCMGEAKL